jgi:hypothetical protein
MALKVKPVVTPVNVDKVVLLHKVVAFASVLWEHKRMGRHAKTVLKAFMRITQTGSNAMNVQRARLPSNQKALT